MWEIGHPLNHVYWVTTLPTCGLFVVPPPQCRGYMKSNMQILCMFLQVWCTTLKLVFSHSCGGHLNGLLQQRKTCSSSMRVKEIHVEYSTKVQTSFSKLKIMQTAIRYSNKKYGVLVDQCLSYKIASLGTDLNIWGH